MTDPFSPTNSKPDHLISLENKKASGGETISRFDYTYDHEGNRLSMAVEPAWGTQTGTIDYDYDLIYQLTGAEGPGFETYPDASFTYDSMGNRVETVFSGQTDNYTSNELNQYTEVSSTVYQYDLNGNLTDDGNQLYEYDYENRLTKIRRKSDNALIAEYRYDPFGRRAKKITDAGATVVSYLYDGAQVIEERDNDFEPAKRFVYGPGIDEPVSIHNVISGETYFYQRDGLGSVTELTDAEGNVVERYRYSPYGKLKIYDGSWNQLTGSTVGNAYFFTGRRYDPESGLYYYRARMYSSEVGRFLQPDPIGYYDSFNLYQYVFNNPTNYIDSLGLVAWKKYSYDEAVKKAMAELYKITRSEEREHSASVFPYEGRYTYTHPRPGPKGEGYVEYSMTTDTSAILHSHTECGERGFSEHDKNEIAKHDRRGRSDVEWYVVDWEGDVWLYNRETKAGDLQYNVRK